MRDFDAMYDEALDYFGSEDESDLQRGFDIFLELAEADYADAYFFVGYCYLNGVGTEEDHEAAVEYLQKAMEDGSPKAMHYLGICAYDGLGMVEDHALAYSLFRMASEYGDEEAIAILPKLSFTADDKEDYESEIVDEELDEDELEEYLEHAEEGSAKAQYLLGKYYADEEDFAQARSYMEDAMQNGLDIARDGMIYIVARYVDMQKARIAARREELEDEVHLTEDGHEPNAILVGLMSAGAEPIYIEDFSSRDSLGEVLGADGVDIVSTMGMRFLSMIADEITVGYVDNYGQPKELLNNATMSTISGYHYLAGRCVVCGYDDDYAPLDSATAVALAEYLTDFDVYDDGRIFEWIARLF